MKNLLEWIDIKRSQYGNIVLLLAAFFLFSFLAILLGVVYAVFIGLIYLSPYLVLVLTLLLVILIVYKNRP
jgi:Flp pilus assembly protein TadB